MSGGGGRTIDMPIATEGSQSPPRDGVSGKEGIPCMGGGGGGADMPISTEGSYSPQRDGVSGLGSWGTRV